MSRLIVKYAIAQTVTGPKLSRMVWVRYDIQSSAPESKALNEA